MLILTQTIRKQISCQIFTNTAAGFLRDYCHSTADGLSRYCDMKMVSASAELRPTLWKRYVDDTLEVIKRGKVDAWSEHLNNMDPTGSIKFTHEIETDNTIAFLDTLLERKEDGSVKVKVYRKKTHTNQYLAFDSYHPLHQKLGVPRTLLNRCDEIVTEEEDRKEGEEYHQECIKYMRLSRLDNQKGGRELKEQTRN